MVLNSNKVVVPDSDWVREALWTPQSVADWLLYLPVKWISFKNRLNQRKQLLQGQCAQCHRSPEKMITARSVKLLAHEDIHSSKTDSQTKLCGVYILSGVG